MKKALIIYESLSGNTKKVAEAIHKGLLNAGMDSLLKPVKAAAEEDFFAYDLVCFGAPSYSWHVPKSSEAYLKAKFQEYRNKGCVLPCAPLIEGKNALVFCTYSGPHTGIREAIPTGLYIGQFFEHFGFAVADEWYVLSEFIGSEKNSTQGRMGNIKGLPSEDDLQRLTGRAQKLAERLFVEK